jgi:hypothetical protein
MSVAAHLVYEHLFTVEIVSLKVFSDLTFFMDIKYDNLHL